MGMMTSDGFLVGEVVDEIDALDIEWNLAARFRDEEVSVGKIFEEFQRKQSGVADSQFELGVHAWWKRGDRGRNVFRFGKCNL